ncbi:MFS transporter [Rubrolithibacter danxiaensis]|uniref:MFS transporter n=1 Tax=Rubrolithibacter danxiaensis TaxID=3390805 RepID=UPI003BF77BB8
MKILQPSENLSEKQINSGLKLVIADGLAAEGMVTLTGGAFLVAIAIHLGASNFQLGLLAALPTFSSIFQLASIWLVRRFNNRRAISVVSNFIARFPLLVIGMLPFMFSGSTSIQVLIFLLFFHYFFGSVAGASWNSWMKDLVPENKLGTYFSHRSRVTQILNVTMSLLVATSLDYIKAHHPDKEIIAYSLMFLVGGLLGMLGVYALSRTPEPKSYLSNENFLKLFKKPLRDKNFRNLMVFHSFWAFSLNMATPFFSVFMLKTLGLPLSYIILFGIVNQISSISALKLWGRYADRFSNKTIIRISAPIYVGCIVAWAFVGMAPTMYYSIGLLAIIHILSGMSTAGVNIALSNIGLKLASKEEAIVYLTSKNMMVALFSTIAPMIGGLMADFFANHEFIWNLEWKSANVVNSLPIIALKGWNFFFVIGGFMALFSLRLLKNVKEKGEVGKERAVIYMKATFRSKLKGYSKNQFDLSKILSPVALPTLIKKRVSGILDFEK